MIKYCKTVVLLLLLLAGSTPLWSQRVIQYESGMGSRHPDNSDVWILYQGVHAMHDGMHLYADSALLDMKRNDFTAFRNIRIDISDTTTLTGDHLVYNGNTKIINIRGKQVILVDGATILMTDKLTYDRNANLAFYDTWGHSSNNDINLESRIGRYDANSKEFYIYNEVILFDTSARLETDTLLYNTNNHTAYFVSPTHIYSDSATMYSEEGSYNTSSNYALSTQASHVWTHDHHQLTGDTLHYYHDNKHGLAFGHVWLFDSINDIACMGGFGESNQAEHYSLVTDSALVVQVDSHGDSLFVRADTIHVVNDDNRQMESLTAYRSVRLYRKDVQAVSDSLYYLAADSVISLYHDPVVWYDTFQCSADTIHLYRRTERRIARQGTAAPQDQLVVRRQVRIEGLPARQKGGNVRHARHLQMIQGVAAQGPRGAGCIFRLAGRHPHLVQGQGIHLEGKIRFVPAYRNGDCLFMGNKAQATHLQFIGARLDVLQKITAFGIGYGPKVVFVQFQNGTGNRFSSLRFRHRTAQDQGPGLLGPHGKRGRKAAKQYGQQASYLAKQAHGTRLR